MKDYIHKVNYYETDKMGITHHSNYVRWMEEARIDFLEQIGFSYVKMEEDGIISPVISLECDYKNPTTFGDLVSIKVDIEDVGAVKLKIKYSITKCGTGELVLMGRTTHCFVNSGGRPIALKKNFPEFERKLKEFITQKE